MHTHTGREQKVLFSWKPLPRVIRSFSSFVCLHQSHLEGWPVILHAGHLLLLNTHSLAMDTQVATTLLQASSTCLFMLSGEIAFS